MIILDVCAFLVLFHKHLSYMHWQVWIMTLWCPSPAARLESDATSIGKYIHDTNSSVSQLHVKMRGGLLDIQEIPDPATNIAAYMIYKMAKQCNALLTHLSVTCEMYLMGEDEGVYDPLLEAASAVAFSTLTHFSYCVPYKFRCGSNTNPPPNFGGDLEEETEIYELDERVEIPLSNLDRLTHLNLGHGFICKQRVWSALSNSLLSLSIHATYNTPKHILLPSLQELNLRHSRCHDLLMLLAACPKLQALHVTKLFTPARVKEQQALAKLMMHPVWLQNNSGEPQCTPVTELHMYTELWDDHSVDKGIDYRVPNLAPEIVLIGLPVMPTITHFKFDFVDAFNEPRNIAAPAPMNPLLHHIPSAFPNLCIMRLDHLLLLDSGLMQLHACTSLIKLDIRASKHVSGQALLQLAAALPKLAHVYVISCKLVHRNHKKSLARLVKKRQAAK